ncbi:hypothetical protein F4803DRAFT_527621 [Xylaria telfairii]|nr:hypothetical protein F4803DRAFT_527621 [Xylaria telfairii]
MEAIATLSLVCNVMQVISFTDEVFQLARSLQNDGSPNPGLVSTAESLNQLLSTLPPRLDAFDTTDTPSRQQQNDKKRLKDLTSNLLQDTENLKVIIGKLSSTASKAKSTTSKGPPNVVSKGISSIASKGKSLSGVLKYKLHYESEITSLERNIDKSHAILNTEFLARICDSCAAEKARSEAAFASLDQKLQDFIELWSQGHRDIKKLISTEAGNTRAHATDQASMLRKQIDTAAQASEAHADARHRETRNHVTSEFLKSKYDKERKELTDRILYTLRFPEMNARENEIWEASEETTRWIFDEKNSDEETAVAHHQFSQWLKEEHPVFWIVGKPGSGKSSLMKFLVLNAHTRDCLSKWRPDVTIYRYFFIETGRHPLQREFRGCLRALLHQILNSKPHILDSLLMEGFDLAAKYSDHDWSEKELHDVFLAALRLANSPICLFLDGLDEIEARSRDRDSIIKLVKELSHLGSAKICVSSRPEHTFERTLGSYPCLRTHDLNGPSIKLYIQNCLAQYKPSSPDDLREYRWLTNALVGKASGVFLWVHLATKSIIDGMQGEDSWHTLRQRIDELEPDLYALFQQMLDRQNGNAHFYKEDTARLLWYFLHTNNISRHLGTSSDTLLGYIFATHADFRSNLLCSVVGAERVTKETRVLERYRKWLSAKGAGFLEIKKIQEYQVRTRMSSLADYTVGPIHRSVQEFLLGTTAGHNILLADTSSSKEILLRTVRAVKDVCYYLADNPAHDSELRFRNYSELLLELVVAGYLTPQEETEELLDLRSLLQLRAPEEFPDSYLLKEVVHLYNVTFLSQVPEAIGKSSFEEKSTLLSLTFESRKYHGSCFHRLPTLDHGVAKSETLREEWVEQCMERLRGTISFLLHAGADLNAKLRTYDLGSLTISTTPFHTFLIGRVNDLIYHEMQFYPALANCIREIELHRIDWDIPFYLFPCINKFRRQDWSLKFRYTWALVNWESNQTCDCVFEISSRWLHDFLSKVDPFITADEKEIEIKKQLASNEFKVQCVAVRCTEAAGGRVVGKEVFQPPDPNKVKEKLEFEDIIGRRFLDRLYCLGHDYEITEALLDRYLKLLSNYRS